MISAKLSDIERSVTLRISLDTSAFVCRFVALSCHHFHFNT
jgi:hypothetical protein